MIHGCQYYIKGDLILLLYHQLSYKKHLRIEIYSLVNCLIYFLSFTKLNYEELLTIMK